MTNLVISRLQQQVNQGKNQKKEDVSHVCSITGKKRTDS